MCGKIQSHEFNPPWRSLSKRLQLSGETKGFRIGPSDLELVENNEAESRGLSEAPEEAVSQCLVVGTVWGCGFALHFHFEQRKSDGVQACHSHGIYFSTLCFFFLFVFGLVKCSLENVGIKRELEL